MDDVDFEPRNDLESVLLAAQAGRVAGELFVDTLLAAQVFVPVRDPAEPGSPSRPERARPLTVVGEDGREALAVFTSPERARPFVAQAEGCSGGLLMDLRALLGHADTDLGVVINPGWPVGLEMAPDALRDLVAGGADRLRDAPG